ncbi:BamA/TamA family outer membrane protein [Flavobacterium daemonense]|uniref:hypothetical protein n=1 Tax=Flavobacterium daemonense TaxID=1393049 RepID=UPI001186A8C1|nr:hypothetical protein [Flavobacterium daemonense]KAF2333206.1 hypothetical protein FND99_11260 [Flavobacterium daemonense]
MKKQLLKQILFLFFFSITSICSHAQNFHLTINGTNQSENQIIDSLNYKSIHPNIKSLLDEVNSTSEKLLKTGYLENNILNTTQINDTTYHSIIELKKQTKFIHIYIGINNLLFDSEKAKNDTIILPYSEVENFLNQKIIDAEKQGFALSKIKLENIKKRNSIIYADLNFKSEKKRTINSIILNYSNSKEKDFFPKGHLKQLNKKYLNKTFNQETTQQLYEEINSYEFISQTKYPEILFTTDSTKIYTYIEKRKANTFDGYIGFSNDKNEKLNINGYIDISLLNTLRAGEQFSLYWKSDGNQQKTFNTRLEIPYIFKSPLGIKAQLNIFKQDSTFQNTKTSIDLGYFLNYNSRIYAGYQATESSDIQNINNSQISDFKNAYFTSSFDYKKIDHINNLLPKKAYINWVIGYGKRNTNSSPETAGSSKQFYTNINASYNFEINDKNFININSQNFYLNSKNYISNELYRFGGMNSIRGFLENSLQSNLNFLILTEYRYKFSRNIYVHTIADYGIYQDLTSSINPNETKKLIGLGIGSVLQTPNGLLKITLTNGSQDIQELQLYNTIVNICYNVKF